MTKEEKKEEYRKHHRGNMSPSLSREHRKREKIVRYKSATSSQKEYFKQKIKE